MVILKHHIYSHCVSLAKEGSHIKKIHRRIIGSFIAASNITGILNDDLAITAVLHSHGALVGGHSIDSLFARDF